MKISKSASWSDKWEHYFNFAAIAKNLTSGLLYKAYMHINALFKFKWTRRLVVSL